MEHEAYLLEALLPADLGRYGQVRLHERAIGSSVIQSRGYSSTAELHRWSDR